MNKILIIEDEKPIADMLKYSLEKEGFKAYTAYTGETGMESIQAYSPDLILLDIMLPDTDGLTICKKVTSLWNIPIVMLTAKSDITDKLLGLEYGADDYITKPFDLREVILRIKTILRRSAKVGESTPVHTTLKAGDVEMNLASHEVRKNGEVIELTPKEFTLLQTLIENKGVVMSRQDLLQRVWDFEYFGDTRTVDIHIQRLRKKLNDDKIIVTVFGVGYKILVDNIED